jgi:hypothetical protein
MERVNHLYSHFRGFITYESDAGTVEQDRSFQTIVGIESKL